MKNLESTKEKGYAILFTVVIVSVISMIALGLANLTYKQLVLSSVAKDSQTAFYQADMASECALFIDNKLYMAPTSNPWPCGIDNSGNSYQLTLTGDAVSGYNLNVPSSNIETPCISVNIKTDSSSGVTSIVSKGYNICDKTNVRSVEREIDVTY